jgi:hypothetical protein
MCEIEWVLLSVWGEPRGFKRREQGDQVHR